MDLYASFKSGLTSPGGDFFDITPSDTVDLEISTRGIIIGTPGDLKITSAVTGRVCVIPALVAGVIHPIRARRIWATSTVATRIVGTV